MVEEKAERTPAKATGKAIEAAMIARLFKDSLDSATPIVTTFVWDRDDGQRLDLGKIKPHPSFPSREVASKRLGDKIVQWVSGEKAGPDKNAVLRLDMGNSIIFDFSMESFEKAALADDGVLVVGVGEASGVEREPMGITRIARLRLFASDGSPVGRRQALMPIKELIHIHQQEREAQAQRLKSEEKQIDDGDFDHLEQSGRSAKTPAGRKPAPADASGLRRLTPATEIVRGSPESSASSSSGMMERQMMQVALMEVNKNMSSSLKEAPAAPGPRASQGPDVVVERIYASALAEGSPIPAAPAPAQEGVLPQAVEPSRAAGAISTTDAAKTVSSQVKVEKAAPKIDPEHVKAAFPDLPGGTDEIHITIERERLAEALEALGGHVDFELRIASKGAALSVGICVPAGQVALLSDFVAAFAKGGVMIRRSPAKIS